jgi:hypothetical protein
MRNSLFLSIFFFSVFFSVVQAQQPQPSPKRQQQQRQQVQQSAQADSVADPIISKTLEALPEGAWVPIASGDRTLCADSSAYRFFIRRGKGEKVAFIFQGGGACWDDPSCLSIFDPKAKKLYSHEVSPYFGLNSGMFDFQNAENPFKDWSFVFVPYCTGDLHLGDFDKEYQSPDGKAKTVYQRGAANASTVLKWSFSQFLKPDTILVMGWSAGGYGAIFWTGTIAEKYPEAAIFQLSDCAVAVTEKPMTSMQDRTSFPVLESMNVPFSGMLIADGFTATAKTHPNVRMAQINTLYDKTLIFYTGAIDGRSSQETEYRQEWSKKMQEVAAGLDEELKNFTYFNTAYGLDAEGFTPHTFLQNDLFYQVEENGMRLIDWLNKWLEKGEAPPVKPD